jgi:ABC-type protease/lipase transport system fused ATPase/permease subunit
MGQRQRVRLSMAFLHDPRLVLLDEPRTSLDAVGVDVLNRTLVDFISSGGTAIWCAPDNDDVSLATSVLVLSGGQVSPT